MEFVFVFRHTPLSRSYCFEWLRTYFKPLGIHIHPHQLRHSCATLLMNSSEPVLTVKTLLGHKWVNTILGYALLYDGTVAADYYQAMSSVEGRLALPKEWLSRPLVIGKLLALVDAWHQGALNPTQTEIVRQLRTGIIAFAKPELFLQDVKVPTTTPERA